MEKIKCGFIYIERGNRKLQGEPTGINGVNIKELEEGESYRYLGVDEDIEYNSIINKDRILKEYYRRVKVIWSSELNFRNKVIAHNSFAVPILVPTIGILEWNIKELEDIDKRTRKILCMTGNFHRNSDVDRLYVKRSEGGRGIKSFESRIVAIRRHLIRDHHRNHLLNNVLQHEQNRIMRLGKECEEMYLKENGEDIGKDNTVTKRITKEINNKGKIIGKQKHSMAICLRRYADVNTTNMWLKKASYHHIPKDSYLQCRNKR